MDKSLLVSYVEQGLTEKQIGELVGKTRQAVHYHLNKHGLCTKNRKVVYTDTHKSCADCKNMLLYSDFTQRSNGRWSAYCKSCKSKRNSSKEHKAYLRRRDAEFKQLCVDYKGGKCEHCGYNKCNAALHFHHVNPDEKDFAINSVPNVFSDSLKAELDKCKLLCANCHAEEHYIDS